MMKNQCLRFVIISFVIMVFISGCATTKSRISGPSHRFHAKVDWESGKKKLPNKPIDKVEIRFSEPDKDHEMIGKILIRGWLASMFSKEINEGQMIDYTKQRCAELGVDGARILYRGRSVNWGFWEEGPKVEEKMELVHYTEADDKDPKGLGAYGEFILIAEIYLLK